MKTTRHPLVRFVRKHNETGGGGGYPALGIMLSELYRMNVGGSDKVHTII